MRKDLAYYAKKFAQLNVNRHREQGVAPHKPVLLISVIELIEQGKIRLNQVPLSPELISTFLKYWRSLIVNKVAFSKNHHWALDHGWFGVDDDYRILIPQKRFTEEPAVESRDMMTFLGEGDRLTERSGVYAEIGGGAVA